MIKQLFCNEKYVFVPCFGSYVDNITQCCHHIGHIITTRLTHSIVDKMAKDAGKWLDLLKRVSPYLNAGYDLQEHGEIKDGIRIIARLT